MNAMRLALAAAAVFLVPVAAVAADKDEPKEERKKPKEKKICRSEKVTGSLTRVNRICMTEAEWKELHARTKQGLDEFNRGASGGCQAPSDPSRGSMC